MAKQLREISAPELVTHTRANPTKIEVRFVGSAENVSFDELSEYLTELHRLALQEEVGEIVVDLRALDFLSAACFRSMLAWVSELQRTPKYRTAFVCDTRRSWQRRSVENLASYGGELVRIA